MMLLKLQSARSRGFRAPPSRLLVCFYSRTAQRLQLCPASDRAVLRPTHRGGTWWFARVGFPTIVCLLRLTPFLHSLVCSGCCCSVAASMMRACHGPSPAQQPLVAMCCFCDVCRQTSTIQGLIKLNEASDAAALANDGELLSNVRAKANNQASIDFNDALAVKAGFQPAPGI